MLFFFGTIITVPLKFKLTKTERYIVYNNDEGLLRLSDFDNASFFDYLWDDKLDKYNEISLYNDEDKLFEYDFKNSKLILGPRNNGEYNKFELVSIDIFNRTFWIQLLNQCITWSESDNKFILSECDENQTEQLFEVYMEGVDMSNLHLLDNYEEETIHSSPNLDGKNDLPVEHTLQEENYDALSQKHLEKDGRVMIYNIYKYLYDMSSCFLDKNVCVKGGFDLSAITSSFSKSSTSSSSSNMGKKFSTSRVL